MSPVWPRWGAEIYNFAFREDSKANSEQNELIRDRLDRILAAVDGVDAKTVAFAEELATIPTGASETAELVGEVLIPSRPVDTYPHLAKAPEIKELEDQLRNADVSLAAPHSVYLTRLQHAILQDLEFNAMDNREDGIAGPYHNTFDWVFNQGRTGNQNLGSLETWLRQDTQDVFWITGKPGSGKSTLMKYLVQHPVLVERLEVWAGQLPLLHAGFYFWAGGSELQRSDEGLYRTILHQCLSVYPELISKVFPRRWLALSIMGTDAKLPRWKMTDLRQAMNALASENNKSLRLALFVDGLDEFAGNHKTLVEDICRFGKHYGVKFCVASRPWNVFVDAFRGAPSIRMQDLTKNDIELFIKREFENSPGFQELRPLFVEETDEILADLKLKAEGVFLWVNLVVRSLVEILRDEPSLALVRQTLADLPTDIELLYNAIWKSIDSTKAENSSKLFQLAMALDVGADGQPGQPSCDAVTIWLAYEADNPDQNIKPLSNSGENNARLVMARFLSSYTRGILEVSPLGRVNFLHRTARDWIQQPDTWEEILQKSPAKFNCKLAATRALALEATSYRETRTPKSFEAFTAAVSKILCYAGEVSDSSSFPTTSKLVEILDNLDERIIPIADHIAFPSSHFLHGTKVNFGSSTAVGTTGHWSTMFYNAPNQDIKTSLISLAAIFAVLPYVEDKIATVGGKQKAQRRFIIEGAALGSLQSGLSLARLPYYLLAVPYSRRLATVEFLLESGWSPKNIPSLQLLLDGELEKFARLVSGRAYYVHRKSDESEESKYYQDLSELLQRHSGLLNALKGKISMSSWRKSR